MAWIKTSSILFALAVSACAASPDARIVKAGIPQSENFQVRRAQSSEYDYVVSIRNGKDLGINADDQAARDRMALLALKGQCEAPQIVKEIVVNGGLDVFGTTARTYELQVKC